ncbi:MAG: hypothetical protein GX442_13715 [Candidatus Riflebacteria bacterium]|nr:hypothetical protein [Candidatus Riflebacteria bacterium]
MTTVRRWCLGGLVAVALLAIAYGLLVPEAWKGWCEAQYDIRWGRPVYFVYGLDSPIWLPQADRLAREYGIVVQTGDFLERPTRQEYQDAYNAVVRDWVKGRIKNAFLPFREPWRK